MQSAMGHPPSAARFVTGSAQDSPAISCLLFRVGQRLCALPVSTVVETMRPLPVKPFAQAPFGVQGMAIIRGTPLPVLALASLFESQRVELNRIESQRFENETDNEPSADASDNVTRFITVKIASRQIALAVGAVIGVETISATSLQQLPPLLGVANARAVEAIGAIDTQLLVLLNAARLVDDTTAAIAAAEQLS